MNLPNSKQPIIILGWTRSFTDWAWLREKGVGACSDRCTFTTDRSLILNASAVVFCCGAVYWNDVPSVRIPSQRYVFDALESAINIYVDWSTLKDQRARHFFNWTNTYRRDSHIFAPYGVFLKRTGTVFTRI